MSDEQSIEDMTKFTNELEEPQKKLTDSATASGCSSDNSSTTSAKNCSNKSIQVDMDTEPGDDPKKNKKYWQDLAGLRGAREQYLEQDIRDLKTEQIRKDNYIKYLKTKLEEAEEENKKLKARRCRCYEEAELELLEYNSFSSLGL